MSGRRNRRGQARGGMLATVQRRRQPAATVEAILESIKDELEELHRIRHPTQKREAVEELMDYIDLHYYDG